MFMGILEASFIHKHVRHWTVNVLCAPKDITGAASPSFNMGSTWGTVLALVLHGLTIPYYSGKPTL